MNTPRKHHYVPRFYLKGFTKEGTEDGSLWVTDTESSKRWKSTPNGAGFEKDFHRVELGPDIDPMWFEKLMGSEVEPALAETLKFVLDTKEIPVGGLARDAFLNLVAFSLVRGPTMRAANAAKFDEHIRMKMREVYSSETHRKEMLAKFPNLTPEKALELLDDKELKISLDSVTHLKAMNQQVSIALDAFSKREWFARELAAGVPDLICSESPVGALPPNKPIDMSTLAWYHPEVLVVMPLSRRVAAIGTMQNIKLPVYLNMPHVVTINDAVMRGAQQLYSSEPTFASTNPTFGK